MLCLARRGGTVQTGVQMRYQVRYCHGIPVGAPELGTVTLDLSTLEPIGGAVVPSRRREIVYSVNMY